MLKQRKKNKIPNSVFIKRLVRSISAVFLLFSFSLVLGMVGYHELGKLSWIDSYLEAAMILSGMGPSAVMKSAVAKFFSGSFALYSGLLIILSIGIIITPIAHRVFHRLNLEMDDKD